MAIIKISLVRKGSGNRPFQTSSKSKIPTFISPTEPKNTRRLETVDHHLKIFVESPHRRFCWTKRRNGSTQTDGAPKPHGPEPADCGPRRSLLHHWDIVLSLHSRRKWHPYWRSNGILKGPAKSHGKRPRSTRMGLSPLAHQRYLVADAVEMSKTCNCCTGIVLFVHILHFTLP